MKVQYRGHSKRTEHFTELCINVASDYNAGLTIDQIRLRYKNPMTGKPYTREHIYYCLKAIVNKV